MKFDLTEASLWISIASFLVAGASAWFARRQARAAEALLRRKEPIFELDVSGDSRADGWSEGKIYIRNMEPLRCHIKTVRAKGRGVLLLPCQDSFASDADGQVILKAQLPIEKASSSIDINHRLGPYKGPAVGGGAMQVRFAYKGLLRAKHLQYDWSWADE